jgi:hypothetical protein
MFITKNIIYRCEFATTGGSYAPSISHSIISIEHPDRRSVSLDLTDEAVVTACFESVSSPARAHHHLHDLEPPTSLFASIPTRPRLLFIDPHQPPPLDPGRRPRAPGPNLAAPSIPPMGRSVASSWTGSRPNPARICASRAGVRGHALTAMLAEATCWRR